MSILDWFKSDKTLRADALERQLEELANRHALEMDELERNHKIEVELDEILDEYAAKYADIDDYDEPADSEFEFDDEPAKPELSDEIYAAIAILEIEANPVFADDVKAAYRKLASINHPDKFPVDKQAQQTEIMQELNAAKTMLLDALAELQARLAQAA